MKKLALLALTMFIGIATFAQSQEKEIVEIYYFHRTDRCATCNAIEESVIKTVEKNYKKDVEKGRLIFKSINFETQTESDLVKKYEIESPTLLIIYNKKGEKKLTDLTEEAFEFARNNPSKFKKILTSKINDFFR